MKGIKAHSAKELRMMSMMNRLLSEGELSYSIIGTRIVPQNGGIS